MGTLDLLRRAHEAGLSIHATDGRLVVRGPRSALQIVQVISKHKEHVLRVLREEEARTSPLDGISIEKLTGARATCDWCRGTGLVPFLNRKPLSTSNYFEGPWRDAAVARPRDTQTTLLVPNYCPVCFGVGLPDRWSRSDELLTGDERITHGSETQE